jgi:hypothetical protein
MNSTSRTENGREKGSYSAFGEPEEAPTPATATTGNGDLSPEQVAAIQRKAATAKFLSLPGYARRSIDHTQTLLGERWACRGGIINIIAPTGVGKSSAVIGEMAVKFACGKPAFGIKPNGKLRILILQAENDDDDMTEMVRDVIERLTDDEWRDVRKNTRCAQVDSLAGLAFVIALEGWLKEHKPDLIILDPLNDYSGCDPSNAEDIMTFYRAYLRPLLRKYQCGCLIIQHTPKMRNWDTSKWNHTDWSYVAAGNADTANAARATLFIEPTYDPTVFRFIAGKRWKRIGWEHTPEQDDRVRYYKYAPTGISWLKAEPEDIERVQALEVQKKAQQRSGRPPFDENKLLSLLARGSLSPGVFSERAQQRFHISERTFDRARNRLEDAEKIVKKDGKWFPSE